MNHMEEIAKMLGVKFGEVFKIDIGGILFETKYYLGELGLFMVGGNKLMTGTLNGILNGRYKIVKIPQNILTEKEKKYLSDFIDPFKSQVTYIEKRYLKDFKGNEKEFISIGIKENEKYWRQMELPLYDAGKYYKGMNTSEHYTLEELGLWN